MSDDNASPSNIAMPDDLIEFIIENYNPDSQLLLTNAWERADDSVRAELAASVNEHRLHHTRRKNALHAAEYLINLDSQLNAAEVAGDQTTG